MAEKTLYITDLDGTLLTNEAKVSQNTADAVKRIIDKGIIFTYATARAYATASRITAGITPNVPAVVYNGTFIVNAATGERISSKHFTREESDFILGIFETCGISPIVYGDIDGTERYSFVPEGLTNSGTVFTENHRGDPRENPVAPHRLGDGEIFHFTCIGDGDRLAKAYALLSADYPSELYRERYLKDMFLEIHPKGATKAEGILELKQILGCDRVVCFGDGKNDIPMFKIADECYAMANADPGLKEIATAVIGDNVQDGVARWFEENLL